MSECIDSYEKAINNRWDYLRDYVKGRYPDDVDLLMSELLGTYCLADDHGDCADNLRIADKSNQEEMNQYMKQFESGCCGFDDWSVTSTKTGKSYSIGFNSGH